MSQPFILNPRRTGGSFESLINTVLAWVDINESLVEYLYFEAQAEIERYFDGTKGRNSGDRESSRDDFVSEYCAQYAEFRTFLKLFEEFRTQECYDFCYSSNCRFKNFLKFYKRLKRAQSRKISDIENRKHRSCSTTDAPISGSAGREEKADTSHCSPGNSTSKSSAGRKSSVKVDVGRSEAQIQGAGNETGEKAPEDFRGGGMLESAADYYDWSILPFADVDPDDDDLGGGCAMM